jgi:hypothetical protein
LASFLDFGGINTLNQWLEIAGSAGFLIGTYLLAHDNRRGYGWFFVMNAATAWLLGRQGYLLFVPQQILSVILVLYALRMRIASERGKS